MGELTMIAIYLVPAMLLALVAKRSRVLRRKQGWHKLGQAARPDGLEAAQVAVVASLGTGRAAEGRGNWRVYKPTWGMRLVTPGLSAALIYYLLFEPEMSQAMEGMPILSVLILLCAAYGCLHVFRYSVSTNGHVLRIRSAVDRERRYALDHLVDVEEDAVHSFRLSFRDGRTVEILKAVEGAAELRHMLERRLEQNLRG